MFAFDFMRRAFFVGMMLAVIVPCIGVAVVLRRLSMIGDALSHTSLAGVALGLLIGINPVLGAICACVAAAFCIEAIRRKMPRQGELAIAIVMSAGVGLAGVLSGLGKGGSGFNSFLFGSIVAISDFELILVMAVSALVMAAFLLLYRELFAICFDERSARLSGVPVEMVEAVLTVLTAVTVSVASRTVGALVVSSLMVLPVACALQLKKSFRCTVIAGAGFGALFTAAGLTVSFYCGLRPGATIALVGVAVLVAMMAIATFFTGERRNVR